MAACRYTLWKHSILNLNLNLVTISLSFPHTAPLLPHSAHTFLQRVHQDLATHSLYLDCRTSNMPASVAADEVEEENPTHEICGVEQLQNHGINKADIDKLKANGFPTVGVGLWNSNMNCLS